MSSVHERTHAVSENIQQNQKMILKPEIPKKILIECVPELRNPPKR